MRTYCKSKGTTNLEFVGKELELVKSVLLDEKTDQRLDALETDFGNLVMETPTDVLEVGVVEEVLRIDLHPLAKLSNADRACIRDHISRKRPS